VELPPPTKESGKIEKAGSKDGEGAGVVVSGLIWTAAAALWAFVLWLWKRGNSGDSGDSTKFSKGKLIDFYPHEITNQNVSVRDMIPLSYSWAQYNIGEAGGSVEQVSSMFFKYADIYSGANASNHRCVSDSISELADLVIWTDHQIRLGYGLFNVEAMAAHLGAYWKAKGAPKMEEHMHQALKGFAKGDPNFVLKNMEEAADSCLRLQPHPNDELAIVGALHNLNLAELEYRFAACEEDGEKRMGHLALAERRVENAATVLKSHKRSNRYDHSSIIKYADGLSAEIQNAVRSRAPLSPVGTYVRGYGPTAASILPPGPKSNLPTVVPLTPLKQIV
jgi:hypothetical protein